MHRLCWNSRCGWRVVDPDPRLVFDPARSCRSGTGQMPSRRRGQLRHRGPQRPRPSSLPAIVMTSIPAFRSFVFVSTITSRLSMVAAPWSASTLPSSERTSRARSAGGTGRSPRGWRSRGDVPAVEPRRVDLGLGEALGEDDVLDRRERRNEVNDWKKPTRSRRSRGPVGGGAREHVGADAIRSAPGSLPQSRGIWDFRPCCPQSVRREDGP